VTFRSGDRPSPEQRRLLEASAALSALAIERVELAEKARRVQVLQEAEKLQAALLNSISHDLRTPLASITGSLSSLSDNHNLDDATQRELVETALGEAERLNRLVGNLLDMTRLEAGIVRVAKEPYDVQDVIGVSLQEIASLAEGRQVVVNVPSGMPLVPMDLVLIARVLFNVLDNAIKYSAPGTPIEISARSLDTYVEIEVADRGMGIPEGDLNHVFDKFYRVQRPNHVTGTGLGLSISKGLVEAHGGRIWANKREGGGTAVTLILPLS
jgi:two-component system sensor histidine kinase KdpD